MTKTPILASFGARRAGARVDLKEPFLLPSGKLHTTGTLERSKLTRRWLVLLLASLLLFCNYYCYDNPSALYANLAMQFAQTEQQFDFWFDGLYSIYSVPNVVLPVFGGLLTDHWGLYNSLNLFATLLLAGQVVFAAACSANSLPLMLLGRFIFGLGGECITVAQTALIERWFGPGELAFAMGLSLSLSRLGSVVNNVASPSVANATLSTAAALWVGAALCVLCSASCLLVGWVDRETTQSIRHDDTLELAPSPPAMSRFQPSPPPPTVSAFGSPRPTSQRAGVGAAPTRGERSAEPAPNFRLAAACGGGGGSGNDGGSRGASKAGATLAALRDAVQTTLVATRRLGTPFWLLAFLCVVVYVSRPLDDTSPGLSPASSQQAPNLLPQTGS